MDHLVMADVETLFRQAPMTAYDYMMHAVHDIDEMFGKGYAKANPVLVAAYMQTAAKDFGDAILARALDSIATHLKYLGVGDAASTMGAIEYLAVHLGEKLEGLRR